MPVNSQHAPISALLPRQGELFQAFLERISSDLLGMPYLADSLIGDRNTEEQLCFDLTAFDCVTLVETVLALYHSANAEQFQEQLLSIRYRDSCVDWRERNHFFSRWIRENETQGYLSNITRELPAARISSKELSLLEGLPVYAESFTVAPYSQALLEQLEPWDLLCFVSDRVGLDYFHVGFLLFTDNEARLFHASKSHNRVMIERLADFLERTQCSELTVCRITNRL